MKILFMSGYADEAVTRSGELSFDAPFIQKPFSASSLLAKVQDILDEPDSPEQC
jgi:FixJ family two-component response regulator